MIAQLSIEILASISIALLTAAVMLAAYSNASVHYASANAAIGHYANMSNHYASMVSNGAGVSS